MNKIWTGFKEIMNTSKKSNKKIGASIIIEH